MLLTAQASANSMERLLRALCGLQQDTEQEPVDVKPGKAAADREALANAQRANMRSDDATFRAQEELRCAA